ncbi:hypothetical protein KEJ27_08895 [Candidatus Bathyarchaeota archaeon]|nr:hypothetical protein [Candidatus Bathyarchaeota archaeon]MBS7618153.1 hypothetical protein [Candidatus Bathyarchaeota archaeon]
MVINLYTPGHGDPLDTLIVNGIVLSLMEEYPDIKIEVLKQASRFIVKILNKDDINERNVIDNAIMSIIEDCELETEGKIGLSFSSQPAVRPENIVKAINGALSHINSSKSSFIEDFSDELHAMKKQEGRGKEKRNLFKVHVQIAPFTGSYLRLPYMTVGNTGTASKAGFKAEEADYIVCPFCFIFSWAGLIKSTSIIVFSTKNKKSTLFILPSPVKATQDDVALLSLIFGEKVEVVRAGDREIPALGGVLYSMASGETIGALSAQSLLDAIYWVSAKEGNFISVRSFGSMPLLNVYKFVAEAKRKSPFLVRLIDTIADREPELLTLLTESLVIPGYNIYDIVRSLWAFLERIEKTDKVPLDIGIVDTLIKLIK